MIAVDTNLLVYAHRRAVPEHAAAAEALRGLAGGGRDWACRGRAATSFSGP